MDPKVKAFYGGPWPFSLSLWQPTESWVFPISSQFQPFQVYPVVNVYITMEHGHAINGQIHYFDWAISNGYVKLPRSREGIPSAPRQKLAESHGVTFRNVLVAGYDFAQ